MNAAFISFLERLENIFLYIVLGVVILEWIILMIIQQLESHKEGWVNIASYIIDSIPYFFLGKIVIFGSMMWLYEFRLWTLSNAWYIWVLAYLAYDFMFWLVHLVGHKVRLFWCIHGVHHTAKEMKLTVAVRGSFLGLLYMPHTIIWLPLLGFNPYMLFVIEAFARLYGLYEHVNDNFDRLVGKQSWLEKFFITPSVHRVHHASNYIYLDRNYGETFSIWDRLFKTFQPELKDVKPVYGIMDDSINSESLTQIQTQFFKDLWADVSKAQKWSHKIKYIWMYPGWNPVDGGKKASVYRAEAWTLYNLDKENQNAELNTNIESELKDESVTVL